MPEELPEIGPAPVLLRLVLEAVRQLVQEGDPVRCVELRPALLREPAQVAARPAVARAAGTVLGRWRSVVRFSFFKQPVLTPQ